MAVVGLAGLLAACTATSARLEVAPQDGVQTTYQRGAPLLDSEKVNRVILKLIDRDEDELLLGVAVENGQPGPFDFSTDDVHLAVGVPGAERAAGEALWIVVSIGSEEHTFRFEFVA